MLTPISPQIFAIISRLIEEKTGLHYDMAERDLLGDKVSRRAQDAGFESLLDYYYYLRYDDEAEREFNALTDALVVGETFFFRELIQLEVIIQDLIGPAVKRGVRPRVWSAACATGEEIFSLAMLLADRDMLDGVDLCASDISLKALARAHAGRFPRRSVRQLPLPPPATRWLVADGEQYVVDGALIDKVRFQRVNLLEPDEVRAIGPCDVILCRNVLIYFAEPTVQRVVQALEAQLRPGAALLVGVSESLLRFATNLTCEDRRGVFMYRRGAP